MMQLQRKKLLIGITGSIAAYKTVFLVREAVKLGYEVKVMLTESAQEFVTPLTLQALSHNKVYTKLFDLEAELSMGHIELAKWADLILIAPATANSIAKYAMGFADDLLSTVILARPSDTPLLIAPAMNAEMYNRTSVQQNLHQLRKFGYKVLEAGVGSQACGDFGKGRMLEAEQLLEHINVVLGNFESSSNKAVGFTDSSQAVDSKNCFTPEIKSKPKGIITVSQDTIPEELEAEEYLQSFKGKKVLVTAGPTREMIDPVRYITNHSSGKMGVYIAALAQHYGADVTLVAGPISVEVPEGIRTIKVESAEQMNNVVLESLINIDCFIGCAAVSDFRAKEISVNKIKKVAGTDEFTIQLVKNPDILANVAASTRRPKLVVGFAAETNNVEEYARNKLITKNCDMICANDVSKENQGWNSDFNHIVLYKKEGNDIDLGYDRKDVVAKKLILQIAKELSK